MPALISAGISRDDSQKSLPSFPSEETNRMAAVMQVLLKMSLFHFQKESFFEVVVSVIISYSNQFY